MQYSVFFQNNSSNEGNVCVYQTDPNIGVANVMSLAWFSKKVFETTQVIFDWTIDYSFTWAETGELVPGVKFRASQNWKADLTSNNAVTFSKRNGAYTFQEQMTEKPSGSLIIHEDGTIPSRQASVGIGMSGKGAFAVQAQPNLDLTFTPHPKYWITFGNYNEGDVLDIAEMTKSAEIAFPPNVYSMTAILNEDNTWTIKPTAQVNAEFVEQLGRKEVAATWGK